MLFERKSEGKRVFPAKVADNVTAALEPIAAYSNGNSLYDSSLGSRPSAAKTGTVQLGDTGKNKDAWMVGYTPQLSTAVWVGTNDGTALTNYSGASIYGSGLPAQIWKAAMNAALEGKEIKEFPEPEAIGGVAGIPYEAPATTYAPSTRSRGPSLPTFDIPDQGGDGNLTLAPGVTIPLPGAPRGGGDSGGGNSPGGGDSGGGNTPDGGGNVPGGADGGGVPEPPVG